MFIYPYYVSNFGNVKNIKTNKILVGDTNSCGYKRVLLKIDNKFKKYFIHRLVATLFIENECKNKNIVNHIDGNKKNNNFNNLEWVTRKENDIHAFKNNLRKCNNKIKIRKYTPFIGSTKRIKIVLGIAPIKGPKNGIIFVTPTIVLISTGYGIFIIDTQIKQRIPIMRESSNLPLIKPPKHWSIS